jgi:hypothetical protein
VIQLLDAYSNTFSYIGRRTTGTRPGSYALVPRGYAGSLPAGVTRIESPTNLVWVLGRTLVRSRADLPVATQVMSGYRVTALASWAAGGRQAPIVLPAFPPSPPLPIPTGLAFYEALGVALAETPAPPADACALRAFAAAAGVGPGRVPSAEQEPVLEAAARAGNRLVRRAEARENRISRARNNGWLVPRGYIGSYGRNWLVRAIVGMVALGANTPPETVYPVAITDSGGRPLEGRRRYTVRFPRAELPPVDAFWSLTMYRDDLYLFENPARRCRGRPHAGTAPRPRRLAHDPHPAAPATRGGARELAAGAAGPLPARDAPVRAAPQRPARGVAPAARAAVGDRSTRPRARARLRR